MGISYHRSADIIECIVKDCTHRKLYQNKCPIADKISCGKMMKELKEKYGFEPIIDETKSVNNKEDWLGMNEDFA